MAESPRLASPSWLAPLLRPVALIAVVGLLTKVLQGVGGILFAHTFGAGHHTDAYLVAKSVAIGVYFIADAFLYNALVPLHRGRDDAGFTRQLARLGGILVLFTVVLTGLLEVLAGPLARLLMPGGGASAIELAARLCRITALGLLLAIPASLLKSINACRGRYVRVSLDSLVIHACVLTAILLAPDSTAIWPLAAAFPAAFAILLAVHAHAARRELPLAAPVLHNPLAADLARLAAPLVAITCLQQVNLLVMNAFVSFVAEGAISWLNLSYAIAQVPVGIIDLILLSAVFPFAAVLVHGGRTGAIRQGYTLAASLLLVVLVPFSLWVFLERSSIVGVALRHGRFDAADAAATALCLAGHAAAILPWTLDALACRCLFALKRHRTYLALVAVRVALNALLAGTLVTVYAQAGVAFAFAAAWVFGAISGGIAVLNAGDARPEMPASAPRLVGRALLYAGLSACVVAAARHGMLNLVRGPGAVLHPALWLAANALVCCLCVGGLAAAFWWRTDRRLQPEPEEAQ